MAVRASEGAGQAAPRVAEPGGGTGDARQPAIRVRSLDKTFRITHGAMTLKERVIRPFRRAEHEQLHALRDVSVEIPEGEFFAVIGRNGSGKSSLLKCLAGIYLPDGGDVEVRGRISPFIELGVGFNPNLNAPDNVMVNATLLGLSPQEARGRFDDVIAFAELQEFVDMKLKNYSSGMQVRLGFASAVQVNADVLLVDEVLAVGDALFQRKCMDTFHRLKDEGRTIVYVSHNLDTVKQLAHRTMLLEQGRVIMIDSPERVIEEYMQRNRELEAEMHQVGWTGGDRYGDRSAEILDAWFEDGSGGRTSLLRHGEPVAFKFRARFHRDMGSPLFAFNVRDRNHAIVMSGDRSEADVMAGETRTFVARFHCFLTAGQHFATPIVAHADGVRWADLRDRMLRVDVEMSDPSGAVVELPHEIEVLPE